MITVIDYGMGNLMSVTKALEKLGAETQCTNDPEVVAKSKKLILPGVGAFGDAVRELRKCKLEEPIKEFIKSNKPFLGICLGLQVLFEESEEEPGFPGLGVIPGKVVRFRTKLKVPHMGWNSINIEKEVPIMKGIKTGDYVYFVHSFYVEPSNDDVALTFTNYDTDFVSMVAKGNMYACQFHPEKSQNVGLRILKNFIEM